MHTSPDQRLLEFIRKFRVDLTPDGTITRLELYHSIEGSMGERLATFEMADRDDDEDPDDLAQEIWDEAESDASMRPTGSVERYTVQAYRGDTREPDEQKSFIVRGRLTTSLIGNGSEPPTALGHAAAEMRRTNDLHAIVVRLCETTSVSMANSLLREREENTKLRNVAFEYEKMRQQLLDRSAEREIAREDAKASQQQTTMLLGALMQLAPVVLSKLLAPVAPAGAAMPLGAAPVAPAPPAPTAIPEPVTVRDRIVNELLESMTMPQVQAMIATFDDAQKQKFLAVYTSFREHPPQPAPAPPGGGAAAPEQTFRPPKTPPHASAHHGERNGKSPLDAEATASGAATGEKRHVPN